jgi:hypothetical protein
MNLFFWHRPPRPARRPPRPGRCRPTVELLEGRDLPSVVITPADPQAVAVEGGSALTYNVSLSSAPTAAVNLSLTPDNGQLSIAPFALNFTTANWATPQPFRVSALNDHILQGRHTHQITPTAVSNDAAYNGSAIAKVVVTIDEPPAFQLQNGQLTVTGTSQSDAFAFIAGTPDQVSLNGSTYTLDPALVQTVLYVGNGGSDTVQLTGDTNGDVVQLLPGSGRLISGALVVDVTGVGSIYAYGGSGDAAVLSDSASDDTFISSGNIQSLKGPGFVSEAIGFPTVYARAGAGGKDVAYLTDSVGGSTFVGAPGHAYLSGNGKVTDMSGFQQVYAYDTSGGTDLAYLYDGAGADSFVATPAYGSLMGTGFLNDAIGFKTVNAFASGGDVAYLYDSPGDDIFVGTPTYSYLSGSGFLNDAVGFAAVHSYDLAGGNDVAYLYGSSGNDTFVGTAYYSYLGGSNFLNNAVGYHTVYAFAGGANSAALLYDAPGTNTFWGQGNAGWFTGPNYNIWAYGFGVVNAYASVAGQHLDTVGAVDYLFQAVGDWNT